MLRSAVASMAVSSLVPAWSTGPLSGNAFGGALVGTTIEGCDP